MDETTNMKLKKPVENEYISIEIINENMDIIDTGMKEISDSVDAPVFDDSGSVVGITNKTTLLASFVSKMPLVKFLRNVKAGFKLVSFVGDIVNNCVTDNANLPLSAAQGKKLMDLYTVLNTNLNEGNLSFDYDNGLYYELEVGADTVRKKLGSNVFKVGSFLSDNGNQTINIAQYYDQYNTLTANDILIVYTGLRVQPVRGDNVIRFTTVGKTYNPITGILTISGMGVFIRDFLGININYDLYIIA